MPHISAIEGLKIALYVLVILGTMRLIALSYPDNSFSQGILLLY